MTNFYKAQMMAFKELRHQIDTARAEGKSLSVPAILLFFTERYEVSEKALLKRIKLIEKNYIDMEVTEEAITWQS